MINSGDLSFDYNAYHLITLFKTGFELFARINPTAGLVVSVALRILANSTNLDQALTNRMVLNSSAMCLCASVGLLPSSMTFGSVILMTLAINYVASSALYCLNIGMRELTAGMSPMVGYGLLVTGSLFRVIA